MTLNAKGMTTRNITETSKEMYDVDILSNLVSKVMEGVRDLVIEWQNLSLCLQGPWLIRTL